MYRTLETALWTDPKVRQVPPMAKLLFIYLITNNHAHVSGIYYLPDLLITHETGIKGIDTLSDTLSIHKLVEHDHTTEVFWVINMLRYQGAGEKVYRGVLQHLHGLHDSPLIPQYLNYYKEFLDPIIARNPRLAIRSRYPIAYPIDTHAREIQEQEQEQEQEKERNPLNEGKERKSPAGAPAGRAMFKKTGGFKTPMPQDPDAQDALRQRVFCPQLHTWIARKQLGYMDLETQWEAFMHKALANNYRYSDWYAAFQSWLTSPYQPTNGVGNAAQRRQAIINQVYAEEEAHEARREHRDLH